MNGPQVDGTPGRAGSDGASGGGAPAHPTAAAPVLSGTGVVPGLGYGPARWVRPAVTTVDTSDGAAPDEAGLAAAQERFGAAAQAVAGRLEERAAAATGVSAEVLKADAVLARDRGWAKEARKALARGVSPQGAAVLATEKFVAMFERLGGRQAERVTDLRDVCARVVAELSGLPEPGVPVLDSPGVLLADDLAPADTAGLDPDGVLAIVTRYGGPTSHTSIIARQLGIPCVVAVQGLESVAEGAPVLVDGARGTVDTAADPERAAAEAERDGALRARAAEWSGPAALADGTAVQLLANVQDGAGARRAAEGAAEGVGLLRTELAFLERADEPSVEEQAGMYADVLRAFPGRKVVVRTLDAGSDKPVAFAGLPDEANPALGVRGIRVDSQGRGLLDRQLDAIAAAGAEAGSAEPTWVMAPMIATVSEARDFAERCRERGLRPGIMVEVPSVAVCVDAFLPHVDFLSIGTNDLTQYVMAADRMSPDLAALTDPWQPAVLRLIAQVAAAGRLGVDGRQVPVGVCGEAAADPYLACVLVGLGVTSLSAAPAALPFVGAQLERVTLERCRELAELAVRADGAREAKAAVVEVLG